MVRKELVMKRIAVLVFLGVFAFTGGWGCSGSSPTDTKLDPTPAPTPVVTPTPTPTPKPGTTPTPTPNPNAMPSISVMSVKPLAGSDVVIGQRVSVTFRATGVTSGLVYVNFSEDGVSRSSKSTGDSINITGNTLICAITMQSVGQTKAIIFYYTTDGGVGKQVPGSTYMVTYNWVNPDPKMIVSIRPGGAFEPRDSGTVPPGTVISYRNDDNSNHQPQSSNSGMVNCHYLLPTETCTIVTYSVGVMFRVSVVDRTAEESHTFTVSP